MQTNKINDKTMYVSLEFDVLRMRNIETAIEIFNRENNLNLKKRAFLTRLILNHCDDIIKNNPNILL
jgi:hypothetical protein